MTIAWELYFQAQGIAPRAQCGQSGCPPKQPHVILAKADGIVKQQQPRRKLTGFCDDYWQHAHLRHGRDEVPDMSFLFNAGVFKRGKRIDPRVRLKGKVTDNEFRSFVDRCLKAIKSPGPDDYTNECVKTMSYTELEIFRGWAKEILAMERARVMTVEETNGAIRLLHKGGVTDDRPQDWRPVVLLSCTNQLVMHILNDRLRNIVEKSRHSRTGRIRREAGQEYGHKSYEAGMDHPESVSSREESVQSRRGFHQCLKCHVADSTLGGNARIRYSRCGSAGVTVRSFNI